MRTILVPRCWDERMAEPFGDNPCLSAGRDAGSDRDNLAGALVACCGENVSGTKR